MRDNMQRGLQAYYARAFPDKPGLQVKGLVSIPASWENVMYAFDVEYGPTVDRQREALVLRLYPGGEAHVKAAHEFYSMRRLHTAGYPVPYVHLLERTNSPLGAPFVIMERVAGQTVGPLVLKAHWGRQRELLTHCCALLVQLHRLDWRPFGADMAGAETP